MQCSKDGGLAQVFSLITVTIKIAFYTIYGIGNIALLHTNKSKPVPSHEEFGSCANDTSNPKRSKGLNFRA